MTVYPQFGIDGEDTELKTNLSNLLKNLTETRGIFLDVPGFDLQDIQNLKNKLNYEDPVTIFLPKAIQRQCKY